MLYCYIFIWVILKFTEAVVFCFSSNLRIFEDDVNDHKTTPYLHVLEKHSLKYHGKPLYHRFFCRPANLGRLQAVKKGGGGGVLLALQSSLWRLQLCSWKRRQIRFNRNNTGNGANILDAQVSPSYLKGDPNIWDVPWYWTPYIKSWTEK